MRARLGMLFGMLFCGTRATASSTDEVSEKNTDQTPNADETSNAVAEKDIKPNPDEQNKPSDLTEDDKEDKSGGISGHCPCCGF